MNQKLSPRFWAVLGVGVVALAGLGLLMSFLGRGPSVSTPTSKPTTLIPIESSRSTLPTPSEGSTVVSVNGHPIRYSSWMEALLLDQVMSGIAGQPAPASEETLERLINEELVMEAFPPEQTPTAEQIEAYVATLEQGWSVDDASVVKALEGAGLTRAGFKQTVERLLMVQAGLEALQSQGYDAEVWLEEQRASADIVLNEEIKSTAAASIPILRSPLATPATLPSPTPGATAAPVAAELPSPTPFLIPAVAPDFTLPWVGGGTFTLTEQLAKGAVVLVFFQKCS